MTGYRSQFFRHNCGTTGCYTDGLPCWDELRTEDEWGTFVWSLQAAAELRGDGLIQPNDLRPLVRGVVKPQRIGAFTARAKSEGLIVATGAWQVSDDTEGRNGGKPARVYRWVGGGERG